MKVDDTEIEQYKFYQYERPISIDNIRVNKAVVFNKISLGKNDFKYFIGYKNAKNLDLYSHFFQKGVHIEEILIKLNVCIF